MSTPFAASLSSRKCDSPHGFAGLFGIGAFSFIHRQHRRVNFSYRKNEPRAVHFSHSQQPYSLYVRRVGLVPASQRTINQDKFPPSIPPKLGRRIH